MISYDKIHYKDKTNQIAQLPKLAEKVNHAFTWGNIWPNMSFTFGEYWFTYRIKSEFLKLNDFGLLKNCILMDLEHKDNIFVLSSQSARKLKYQRHGAKVKCDCVLVTEPGYTVTITSADCIDTIIHAVTDRGEVITGVVHTGWRGVNIRLAEKVIRLLTGKYRVKVRDIHLGILPSIDRLHNRLEYLGDEIRVGEWGSFIESIEGDKSEEIGVDKSEEKGVDKNEEIVVDKSEEIGINGLNDQIESAQKAEDDGKTSLKKREPKNRIESGYYIDQLGYLLEQYHKSGVPTDNIEVYNVDTYTANEKRVSFSHKYFLEHDKALGIPEGRFMLAVRS